MGFNFKPKPKPQCACGNTQNSDGSCDGNHAK